MKSEIRVSLLEKLSAIVSKYKKLDCITKSFFATRKTSRSASQTCEIMSQVSIGAFNGISLTLVFHWIMNSRPIENRFVTLIVIAEVIMTLNAISQHFLKFCTASFGTHLPSKNAASFSVNKGQDVDPVFFSSMKVYNSSISTV